VITRIPNDNNFVFENSQDDSIESNISIRVFDFIASAFALIVLFPVFLLIAIAIRLDSPGTILFRQKRVGYRGKIFTCYKFRSMRMDAEELKKSLQKQNERGGPVFKLRNDPRVTRVGAFLRRSSLDELPQLFNIFNGDMSIVGPRPGLPQEVEKYSPTALRRLAAPPGLTGLWQVSGRAKLSFDEMVELDLRYINNRSLWANLKIILKTIPAVLFADGAY
jgi:exopolysaccharide biosynthesis polyprenyl glycosylphosphotransferase